MADQPQLPIDMPAESEWGIRSEEKQKAPRVYARALCPYCRSVKPIRLYVLGTHIIWAVHNVTRGKSVLPCRASAVAICNAMPRDEQMRTVSGSVRKARCFHGI